MATFYFNGAVDDEWTELGNWWMNYDAETDTYSVPATSLPTSTDSIEVRGDISSNSGSEPTVVNAAFFAGGSLVTITVTGNCTFNGGSYLAGIINGNCTFNDGYAISTSTINGNATFNGLGRTHGTVTGNAIFTASEFVSTNLAVTDSGAFSWNMGNIGGTITFSSETPVSFVVNGGGGIYQDGTTVFGAYASDWIFATPGQHWTFNNGAINTGTINAPCTFNDGSYNDGSYGGTITGDCTFNDGSYNTGVITGDCTFNDAYNSSNYGGGTITGDCTFNDGSYNDGSYGGTITGDCTFNDDSYNNGTITGNCTFNDSARNYVIQNGILVGVGKVNGNCTFSLSSAALHIDQALDSISQIAGNDQSITGTIDFKYDKGINGSSILGVV